MYRFKFFSKVTCLTTVLLHVLYDLLATNSPAFKNYVGGILPFTATSMFLRSYYVIFLIFVFETGFHFSLHRLVLNQGSTDSPASASWIVELFLSSSHVGPRVWTQVFMLGGECLYPLSHGPLAVFFFETGFFFFLMYNSLGCPATHSVDQAGIELRGQPSSASPVVGLNAACITTSQLQNFLNKQKCLQKQTIKIYREMGGNTHLLKVSIMNNITALGSKILKAIWNFQCNNLEGGNWTDKWLFS